MKHCFVIMPYGGNDEKMRKHFAGVYQSIIAPAAEKAGYIPKRSDFAGNPGNITHDIIQDLADSDIVIADLTNSNPNVFFELGIRHAFRKSGTVHIIDSKHDIPFDVRQYRAIEYTTDLVDISQTIDKIVDAIRKREENPQYPDNPVHDAIQDLPTDIRSTGDPALRNQLKQAQVALETLQIDREKLFQKLVMLDPSRAFNEDQTEINVDALLDQAEEIMHSTGEHALLRLKNSLTDGGTEAFVKELRSVLKSPYLDENDFMEIVRICRQLGLQGHRIAVLEVARARYPYSSEMLLAQIDAFDDSNNRQDNERGRILIEEYLQIKHTEKGPAMTNTNSFKHGSMSIGLLFNFYRRANKLEWILSIANSADALGLKSSLIERNRASALSNLGRTDEAEKSFLRAIELNPNDDQAVSWYADFLDDAGKYKESYALFENAITLDPQDGGLYVNLGIQILNRGLIPTKNGSFIGPVSDKDRVKAVVPLFMKAIEISRRQDLIEKIVRVLVRKDAVYEAEAFAKGTTPEGDYNIIPLGRILSRFVTEPSTPQEESLSTDFGN